MRKNEVRFPIALGKGDATYGDGRHIGERITRLLRAKSDGPRGKSNPLIDATEPVFFNSHKELTTNKMAAELSA